MPRTRSKEPLISLDFGNALRAARKAQSLTTTELGRRIDKRDSIISMYESGQQLPPRTTLDALEREVKTSLRKEWEKVKPEWDRLVKGRKAKRAAKPKGKKSKTPSVSEQIAALLTDAHVQRMTPAEKRDLLAVIEDARQTLKSRGDL